MGWMTLVTVLALGVAAAPGWTAPEGPQDADPRAVDPGVAGEGAADAALVDEALVETFAEGRAAAVARLVDDLAELAAWCNSEKLFLARNRIYDLLLEFDLDHDEARKMLKYRRARDGSWERSDTYREPTDRGARSDLEQVAARRVAIGRRFSDALHALFERFEHELTREQRDRAEAEILRVDPDDPATRAARGEERVDGAWILFETARGRSRREELRSLVQRAVRSASAPADTEPFAHEQELGLDWTHAVTTGPVRVLGTGERAEVLHVARVNHAVGDVFRGVFGTGTEHFRDYTIYLLVNEGDKETFLANHPSVTPENRDYLASLVGTGVPGTADVVQWQADPAARLDGIVRHTFGGFLRDAYGISTRNGWVWEGVGIYLTWRVLGTRLTWYVQPDDYELDGGVSLRSLLHVPGSNWTDEAYKLLRSKKRPELRPLLGRTVLELRVQDMLYAYALAAYLLEGRPDEAPGLLRRLGEGEDPEAAFEAALGLDLDELPDRVTRWLSERR